MAASRALEGSLAVSTPCGSAVGPLISSHSHVVYAQPSRSRVWMWRNGRVRAGRVQALVMEPSDSANDSVEVFVKRIEQAWLISKQPRPVQCASCEASGTRECQWCKGTGFFFLGDNMLCEVPSRNTQCRVCFGEGTMQCDDCKGTGYRARWLGQPSRKRDPIDDLRHP